MNKKYIVNGLYILAGALVVRWAYKAYTAPNKSEAKAIGSGSPAAGITTSEEKTERFAYANQDNVSVYKAEKNEDGTYKVGAKLGMSVKNGDKLGQPYHGTQVPQNVLDYFLPIQFEKTMVFVPKNQVKF